jgi:hypothetical protein
MKIMVGAVLSVPPFSAGMAWNWMHTVLGLRKLGHRVCYVEEVKPSWCVDAQGRRCGYEQSVNREWFRATMARFGLTHVACQVYDSGKATTGLPFRQLLREAAETDLLINMSGHVKTEAILEKVRRRVYVDQDPVYTQLWRAEYGAGLDFDRHDTFFTVGLNIGTRFSHIPDGGVTWKHTLPPVVPELWPYRFEASAGRFTTVASWSTYGDLQYRGRWYRSKYAEFNRFAELPRRVDQQLEVRLKCFREDDPGIRRLRDNGWILSEAPDLGDLSRYQEYIARSRAEIGIAKGAYVAGRSGWFGDRWSHYLASGKPVLAQSTGFERLLPTGHGLLPFRDMEEAVAGIEAINRSYETHCRAAREFAEEYLSYAKVLPAMLDHASA